MKTRFTTLDVICGVCELQQFIGMRVHQIYDIDKKTLLFRLQGKDTKITLLLESGIRFHTTCYEWPKNVAPSGFCMKLRKHLRNKRLEQIEQIKDDRIVNFQFGTGEASYHVILELFDRGNILLSDWEMKLIYVLRPHVEGEEMRFAVGEIYAMRANAIAVECWKEKLLKEGAGKTLRQFLMQLLKCGMALVEHVLFRHKLNDYVIADDDGNEMHEMRNAQKATKTKQKKQEKKIFKLEYLDNLQAAIDEALELMTAAKTNISKGFIVQKEEQRPSTTDGDIELALTNEEFQSIQFEQFSQRRTLCFDTFFGAVDEYFGQIEHQRIEAQTLQQEREVIKKLSNVREDHKKRMEDLMNAQTSNKVKAELICSNQQLVDEALTAVSSLLAQQMSWSDIKQQVASGKAKNLTVASVIKELKLETNTMTLLLADPYAMAEQEQHTIAVDVDLSLSAWANACKYFDNKRYALKKEERTLAASKKALKSAEHKTQQTLKDMRTICNITKVRKIFWFEKFHWFISSENYLVIAGRDGQQNELIVKRYMQLEDIYVHAEIQGGSSVVIKNPKKTVVTPKTLLEAGTMAISYSISWNAKIVCNAYWVHAEQVSKTAPTGEYMQTGSFMIRGKKNFLPNCQLVMGVSILFRLEDGHVAKHCDERKCRNDESCEIFIHGQERDVIDDISTCVENTLQSDEVLQNSAEYTANIVHFPDTEIQAKYSFERAAETAKVEYCRNQNLQDLKSKAEQNKPVATQHKRGQNKKRKKLKTKYKDQDEEERELRMQLLNSAGNTKVEKSLKVEAEKRKNKPTLTKQVNKQTNLEADEECTVMLDANADFDILNALTGRPFVDDELLFAVPIVAPYQALCDYKFKLKITPGTGKRGRAAKNALTSFMHDKTCDSREKDLLKQIKEEQLARNMPGKVKLALNQQFLKKITTSHL